MKHYLATLLFTVSFSGAALAIAPAPQPYEAPAEIAAQKRAPLKVHAEHRKARAESTRAELECTQAADSLEALKQCRLVALEQQQAMEDAHRAHMKDIRKALKEHHRQYGTLPGHAEKNPELKAPPCKFHKEHMKHHGALEQNGGTKGSAEKKRCPEME